MLGGPALYALKRLSRRELALLAWGLALGAMFEFPIFSVGDHFLGLKMAWPMPAFTVPLWHAFWDGGLFMVGFALTWLLGPRAQACTRFRWSELAVLTAWGFGSSFIVEFIGNGIIWQYHPHPYNPIIFTIAGRGYTGLIHLIWLVVPGLFYLCALHTKPPQRADAKPD